MALDSYAQQYREAVALFDVEKFEACIGYAKIHLTDPSLSRYWRMKTMILIAGATDDWYEGENYRRQAEQLWFATRRLYPGGADEKTEAAMQELRSSLDWLEKTQEEEAPPEVERAIMVDDEDENVPEEDEDILEDAEDAAEGSRENLRPDINVTEMGWEEMAKESGKDVVERDWVAEEDRKQEKAALEKERGDIEVQIAALQARHAQIDERLQKLG